MAKVGIPPGQRDAVLACVAAVLHLGNVKFTEGRDADSSMVAPGAATEALSAAGERALSAEGGGALGCVVGAAVDPVVAPATAVRGGDVTAAISAALPCTIHVCQLGPFPQPPHSPPPTQPSCWVSPRTAWRTR